MPASPKDARILLDRFIERARLEGGRFVRRYSRSTLEVRVDGDETEFLWAESPVTKAVALNVVQTFGSSLGR